jgi:DNA gyrase/topoisomerase IV subunit B
LSEEIKKLTPYQHVRLRTSVYYGSTSNHTQDVISVNDDGMKIKEYTWVPAVYTALRELIDNALDEVVVKKFGNSIKIDYDHKNMIFTVEDNGRGIPIDWDETHRKHKVTLALSELMAGRNFDNRDNTAGMNGIGASGVNFCSEWFEVEVIRDGQRFFQKFEEGSELFDELQTHDPVIKKHSGTATGTKVSAKLSKYVFKKMTLPLDFVRSRVYEIAYCNPKIKITFNGQLIKTKGDISKTLLSNNKSIPIKIENKNGFSSEFYLINGLLDKGEHAHSIVNNIATFDGGRHIDSFKRYFASGLLSKLENESKRRKLTPNRSDIYEGLVIFNITKMRKPEFDSQSKTRLINEDVDTYIKTYFDDDSVFKDIIKKHKDWIDEIYARCAARTQKKDDADLAKAGRKLMRQKVPKLLDANGKDRSKCVLLICEGDSAVSQISAVRDPEIHGALPLRGKILNVRGEAPKDIIANQIIIDLMTSVGCVLGQRANRQDLRYGKVYLAADQDPDGANITALLVNFFFLHWPELFDPEQEPFFYAFQTPFIIQEKGKKRYYWYAHNYHEYKPEDWKGAPKPTRAKGLGSLEEEDWVHSLKYPQLIPLTDDGGLGEALDLIFNGARADNRKAWISL